MPTIVCLFQGRTVNCPDRCLISNVDLLCTHLLISVRGTVFSRFPVIETHDLLKLNKFQHQM